MVIIQRAGHVLTVSKGAFKTLYKPMGYVIVGDEGEPEASPAPGKEITPPDTVDGSEDDLSSSEDESEDESDGADADLDDEEDADLEEKPLSEMNFKELKAYAKRRGINTNGMSSKKEVRDAILVAEEEE